MAELSFLPNGFGLFKEVFIRHLRLCAANSSTITHPLAYLLISLLSFKLAIGAGQVNTSVGLGIILVLNTFVLIFTRDMLVSRDFASAFLQQLYLTGCEFLLVILAKYLAHIAIYTTMVAFTMPIALFLMNIDYVYWPLAIAAGTLLSFIIVLFLLLSSSLLLGTKANALDSVVLLLFTLPALILATLSILEPSCLLLMLALLLFLLPVVMLSSRYLLISVMCYR